MVIGFGIELTYSKQSILVESMSREKLPFISLKQKKLLSSGCILVGTVKFPLLVLHYFAKLWN